MYGLDVARPLQWGAILRLFGIPVGPSPHKVASNLSIITLGELFESIWVLVVWPMRLQHMANRHNGSIGIVERPQTPRRAQEVRRSQESPGLPKKALDLPAKPI